MKNISICVTLLWIGLMGTYVNAHEIPTHQNISHVGVSYLKSQDSRFSCAASLDPNIEIGTAAEDNWPRFMFHFFPALNAGIYHSTCASPQWGFDGGPCTETGAPNGFTSPTGATLTNDHTYDVAVTNATGSDGLPSEQGWVDLGYVVHLLEDLTSPPHTRNDPHPIFDPFEKYNNGRTPATPTGGLITLGSAQAYFNTLQSFTQSNYYSSDTVFDPSLPGPAAASEDKNYFYDAAGRRIAAKGPAYKLSCMRPFLGCDRTKATIDKTIALEQFDELGPIAAQYAASFMKFYFDNANPAVGNVVNGGFETGDIKGWTAGFTPGGSPTFPQFAGPNGPYVEAVSEDHLAGSFSARLGRWDQPYQNGGTLNGPPQPGAEPAGTDTMFQDIDLPSDVTSIQFSFAYNIVTFDAGIFDWLDAIIQDATSGGLLVTLLSQASSNPGPDYGLFTTTGWQTVSTDLSAFKGSKIRIFFGNHQDGFGDQNAAYIDKVQITCKK